MMNNFTHGDKVIWQKILSLIDGYLWNPRNFGTQATFDFNTLKRDQKKTLCIDFFWRIAHKHRHAKKPNEIFSFFVRQKFCKYLARK